LSHQTHRSIIFT